jgi:hypothetical protein
MNDPELQHSTIPSQEAIGSLLKIFKPHPSPRFFQLLRNAPWERKTTRRRVMHWGYSLIVLLAMIILCLSFSPPLRGIARQWIYYFLPDPLDRLEFSLEGLPPEQLFQVASKESFPLTIDQATNQAGFNVLQPGILLPDLLFVGARYEPDVHSVIFFYQGAGYNLFLSQHPLSVVNEFFSIGASAEVDQVKIGNVQGEYVTGGWVVISNDSPPSIEQYSNIQAVWDPTLPQYTLRWQLEGMSYELRGVGSRSPEKSDIIIFAESLR